MKKRILVINNQAINNFLILSDLHTHLTCWEEMYTLALNCSGAFHSHLARKDPNKHSHDLNKYIKNKTVLYLSLESENFASQLNRKHLTKYKYQEELKSLKHVFFPSL